MRFFNFWQLLSNTKNIVILCLISLLFSCATSNKTNQSQDKQITDNQKDNVTTKSEQIGQQGEQSNSADNNLEALANVIDPMANIQLPAELKSIYQQIEKSDNSDNATAIKNTEALIQLQQKYPKFSGPSYRLARIYYQQKNYAEALTMVNQAIQINPNNYFALNLQGLIYRETGEFELAKQSYLSAIKTYSNHPNSHLNLAILADIYLYDFELALNHYQKYMQIVNPTDEKVAGWILDLKRRMNKEES